ncbi:SAM-dependent methyltransferase [Cryobacterium sp. MP_M5]|nr:SAM-dependent methyltransferase [Cryobacterium sp. MP_M5]
MQLNGSVTSALVDQLRADLGAAHYSVSALTGLWGIEADAALRRNQRVPALRALTALRAKLGRTEPSATLARLFVLGLPVTRADLAAALPSLGVSGAEALGLVAGTPDGAGTPDLAGTADRAGTPDGAGTPDADERLRPLLELRPYSFVDEHGAGSWWIASDLGELALGRPLGETHVLGVGGASLTLSGLLIPTQVRTALDLGTGCGIQALHAARHADRVVATDISVRALELAALNARLNGIRNIEFRLGSLFEPVAGERFDHIISNPPFVITPRTAGVPSYEYRDGGMVGDALVEAVVRGAAEHLTPGGVAQLLGNWEYRTDQDAFDRLGRWLDAPQPGGPPRPAPGLDAWIIEREVQSPALYAETWIRDGGTRPGTADFDRLYGAWLDDFEARGVSQVGFGYMLLRRPTATGAGLRRLERLPGALGHNPAGIGSHLAACLAAHDRQAATDAGLLSRMRLTVASDVTEERHYWPGQEDPTLMTLHQGGGFGRSVPLATALAALVGACDGDLDVGSIVSALAQLLEVDEAELAADLLPGVRGLIDDGFLLLPA